LSGNLLVSSLEKLPVHESPIFILSVEPIGPPELEKDSGNTTVKTLRCGVDWLPHFNNEIDVVSDTGIKKLSC
jgi:hypothetical protein